MPRKPFDKPGPGRPKGLKNKIPGDLKSRVFAVWKELEDCGKGLAAEGKKNPRWFYETMLKPMLPKNVDLSVSGDITIEVVRFGEALPAPQPVLQQAPPMILMEACTDVDDEDQEDNLVMPVYEMARKGQ